MSHTPRSADSESDRVKTHRQELAELVHVQDVALDMIERSGDLDDLLDRILDEYETRLRELPTEALAGNRSALSPPVARKLRALLAFAAQAAAVKEKAAAAAELRSRAEALGVANANLERALSDAEAARRELDGVLGALDAGILILAPDGKVRHANPAARRLAGGSENGEGVVASFLGLVPRGQDGEVTVGGEDGGGRVLVVARRELGAGGSEVVLLNDITRRSREIAERHRLEKLAEVLRTLSVLSHKINNPLTSLLGRAQILKATAGADLKVVKAAGVIEESSVRIAELIRELATVVKEGRQEAVEKVLEIHPECSGGGR